MEDFWPFVPWLGVLLGLGCLAAAFRSGRRRRLVENLPTSKTTGVFIGLVDLKGTAETAQPLVSYLAAQTCVHYTWNVEEHWSRTVTETYTDSDGKTKTRTRHESGWTSVASGGEMVPFFLRDDCGVILVWPEGAEIEPATLFDETCGLGDPLYYGRGPAHGVMDSDHRRRFTEQGILQHAMLYVVGQARERKDLVAPEIAQDPHAPMYLISTRSEEQVRSGMRWGQWLWTVFALAPTLGGFLLLDANRQVVMETQVPLYAGVGLGFAAVVMLSWIWMVYNSLVDLRQRVRQAWSLVDVQLQRRSDLIPNLVTLVKGCRDYERQLQSELASLRGELLATPPGVTGPDFRAVSKTALAIAERYPELKADANFLALQKSIVDTEQRIALARGYFNDITTHYNTRLEVVPEGLVASLAGMKPERLMAANDFERAAVKIDLVGKPAPAGS